IPGSVQGDARAKTGGHEARLEHASRTGWHFLRAGETRIHGRAFVPVHGRRDDRHEPAGISRHDGQGRAAAGRLALAQGTRREIRARIIAGVGPSHTPAIGAAVDNGKTGEAYWAPMFKGYEPAKKWIADVKPDVVIMVYNDHVNAFDFKIIPTFALGCA